MRQNGFYILEGNEYQGKFQHLCPSTKLRHTWSITKLDLLHPGIFHVVGIKPSAQTPGKIQQSSRRRGPARTLNPSQSKPLCVKGSFVPDCNRAAQCLRGQAPGMRRPALVAGTSLLFDLFLNELRRDRIFHIFKYHLIFLR